MLLESGGTLLRYKLLEEDEHGETAVALARRLGHGECQAILAAKIQELCRPDETLGKLVGLCLSGMAMLIVGLDDRSDG